MYSKDYYCKTVKKMDNFCCSKSCKDIIGINGFLNCKCGQEINRFEWKFKIDRSVYNIVLSNENKDILFHPEYSSGTAVLRGDTPFSRNRHHYWEVKILSHLYGTDVMLGVGTKTSCLKNWSRQFCSALGLDPESWGYSYNGKLQHNHQTRIYGDQYGLGSLVGVYLDTFRGTLEYYINRRPIGLAFIDLKKFVLYPMACCTVAKTGIRLTCSVSESPTLQIECLKVIMKNAEVYRQYREELSCLANVYDRKYFWIQPPKDVQADAFQIKNKKRARSLTDEDNKSESDVSLDEIFSDNLKPLNINRRGHFVGNDGSVFDVI